MSKPKMSMYASKEQWVVAMVEWQRGEIERLESENAEMREHIRKLKEAIIDQIMEAAALNSTYIEPLPNLFKDLDVNSRQRIKVEVKLNGNS